MEFSIEVGTNEKVVLCDGTDSESMARKKSNRRQRRKCCKATNVRWKYIAGTT